MASNLPKIYQQSFNTINPTFPPPLTKTRFPSLPFPSYFHHHHHFHFSFKPSNVDHKPKTFAISPRFSLSSSTPPTSKEEAILQAKTCLSKSLEKPLNNPKFAASKIKKLKQPRFRLEIPVIDDSLASLSQLAVDVFGDLPVKRKGSDVKILILWSDAKLAEAAIEAFKSLPSNRVDHVHLLSLAKADNRVLSSADVAVIMAPESSQLGVVERVTDGFYPKPVVIFNPRWGFEEESGFGDSSVFVRSFEVVYSFMGLEVKGILSKRRGVIFKCVRDGVLSGEKWTVLVEEENGELKTVSSFKARPSIDEVETVLYNVMAMNSPLTKSAKFLRGLVSNVTGKKVS